MKVCFVIAPIGDEGTDIRRRSDQVLDHVVAPAAKQCGYTAVRADRISEPGIITSQVIQHLIDDPIVVADLTGKNPNVFYELAVRHAARKPVIQLIESREPIPFDVASARTIRLDHRDLDSAAKCREELIRQIRSAQADPAKVDSPISTAVDLRALKQSTNPLEKVSGQILSTLQEVKSSADALSDRLRSALRSRLPLHVLGLLAADVERLVVTLHDLDKQAKLTEPQLLEVRGAFDGLRNTVHILALQYRMTITEFASLEARLEHVAGRLGHTGRD